MGRLLARLLGSLCLVTLALSQVNEIAYQKLKVFTNLQTDDPKNTLLPPFPVGLQLDLTCQTTGRKTFWFDRVNPRLDLATHREETLPGLHSSVFTIKALSSSDDGRQLMCMRDGSTNRVDVELSVLDKPDNITVNMTNFKGELTCIACGIKSQLELCWFKDGREQICQTPDEDDPSNKLVISLDVNIAALEQQKKSSVFSCRPQLIQTDAIESLAPAALMHYQTMFQTAQEEVEIAVVHGLNCESDGTAVIILEDELQSGCYKVDIKPIKPLQPTASTEATITTTSTAVPTYVKTRDPPPAADRTAVAVLLGVVIALSLVIVVGSVIVYLTLKKRGTRRLQTEID